MKKVPPGGWGVILFLENRRITEQYCLAKNGSIFVLIETKASRTVVEKNYESIEN